MAGKDQRTGGRTGSTRASNVVHMRPRQWLETDEELVPIGREPSGPEPSGREPSGSDLHGRAGSKPRGAPWAASDFWSEEAAYVQDALEAPVPAPGREGTAAERENQRTSGPQGPSGGSTPRGRRAHVPRELLAFVHRAPALAVVALAGSLVVLVAFIAFSALGGAPAVRSASSRRSASASRSVNRSEVSHHAAHAPAIAAPVHTRSPARRRGRATTTSSAKKHAVAARSTGTHFYPASSSASDASTAKQAVTPTYAQSASTSRSSPAPSKPTGPSGPISLIGAGTTPSG